MARARFGLGFYLTNRTVARVCVQKQRAGWLGEGQLSPRSFSLPGATSVKDEC